MTGPLRRQLHQVRVRVTATAVLVALLAGVLASFLFVALLRENLTQSLSSSASTQLDTIAARLRAGETDQQAVVSGFRDVVVQVVRNDRVTGTNHADITDAVRRTPGQTEQVAIPGARDRYLVAARRDGDALLVVALSDEQVSRATGVSATLLLVSVPVGVVVLALVVWLSVGRALRPVEAMRTQAARITSDHLHRRLVVPGGADEIPRLARTLNEMLDRIDASHQQQRQFVSDASHELRSPLAALRQLAEVARRHPERVRTVDFAQDVLTEERRMEELVTAMLTLARPDDSGVRREVDVDDLVLDDLARHPASDDLTVDASRVGAGRVIGDPVLLSQAVRNLMANARRHARSCVVVELDEDDQRVRLVVHDDGNGIAPDQREAVFERFVRLDEARAREEGGAVSAWPSSARWWPVPAGPSPSTRVPWVGRASRPSSPWSTHPTDRFESGPVQRCLGIVCGTGPALPHRIRTDSPHARHKARTEGGAIYRPGGSLVTELVDRTVTGAVLPTPVRFARAGRDAAVRTGAGAVLWLSLLLATYWWVADRGLQDLTGWSTGLVSTGRITGLVAAVLLLAQVVLMARVSLLEKAFGQDRLARIHRLVGFTSFNLMVAHIVLITWGYAAGRLLSSPATLWDLVVHYPGMLLGAAGTVCLAMVVVTSIRSARRRLRYESWHLLHLYAYLGVGLALPHQLWTGEQFTSSTSRTVFWWAAWIASVGAVLVCRVGRPVVVNLRHRLRVAAVVDEGADLWSVHVTGRQLHRLRAEAGQFFSWRFLTGPGWSRANPYSISAAPDGTSLRITVQGVGDGSDATRALRPGTRVLVEGPYGRLSARARTQHKVALIGAGVGVTPLRALAEGLGYAPGDAVYVERFTGEPLFAAEVDTLSRDRGLRVVRLGGHRRFGGSWLPAGIPRLPDDVSDDRVLRTWIPDIAERDVYVCGPEYWTDLVRASLLTSGPPEDRLHLETFSW